MKKIQLIWFGALLVASGNNGTNSGLRYLNTNNNLKFSKKMEKLKVDLFVEQKPQTFISQNDVNKRTVYNHNVRTATIDDVEGYLYDSMISDWPLTSNSIFKQLLEERFGIDYEQKVQNEYFSVIEGIDSEASKQPYIKFLTIRKALKGMVEKDFSDNGL